jgi:thymidylate kinase
MTTAALDTQDKGQAKNMKRGRNPSGLLVCFVGIDGSGKSTLARSLATIIGQRGTKCRYVWMGFNDSFTIFRPVVAAAKGSVFRGSRHMEESRTKGMVVKSPVLSTIYQYLVLADYILQSTVRVGLPLALGRNVICDRYIYDLIVAVGVLLDYSVDRTMALLDRCLAVLPKPDLVFLVDVPEELAFQRKDDVVSLDFLSVRRDIYLQIAEQCGMTIVDGSRDPNELAQMAASEVFQHVAGE